MVNAPAAMRLSFCTGAGGLRVSFFYLLNHSFIMCMKIYIYLSIHLSIFLSICLSIYMCVCVCVCVCVYMNIYIYMYIERDRERNIRVYESGLQTKLS